MKPLRHWLVLRSDPHFVELLADEKHLFRISVLEEALFRVSVLRNGALRNERSWSIAPGGDVPWEGRKREANEGFSCPAAHWDAETATLETTRLRLRILAPLALEWSWRAGPGADWQPLLQDRPEAAYMLGSKDHRNAHFIRREPGDLIYGLGEKAGPLERSGRRYEMRNLDALGYDAATTDPLYKHWPFTMTLRPDGAAYGIFYDNLANSWFDLGNELDNYHPPYRAYRAEDGDLQYYIHAGPDLLSVVKSYHRSIGGMAFMPLWGLGYSGSSMALADAPDGQARIEAFLTRCSAEDIPLDSFQMSSGYTTIGAQRYVFNWNTDRFPDLPGMVEKFDAASVRLVANIKPVLLDDHPRYSEAAKAGLFVRDAENAPEISAFWDGRGSHLDMTNPETIAWWQGNLTQSLLARGITSSWNDNNEYEVWDDSAHCAGFGTALDMPLIRPLHGQLMARASFDAQRQHTPNARPYLISRSASPGTQRYAQSWTGDNATNWNTLRYNIPMGLGLSLSGYFNIGHDVGGFAGPAPGPELFLRWVQNGIFHPRFTIHSWNDDGTSNVPWMHADVAPLVRDAIHLRYRLMPYLYTQLYRAAALDEPMLRPLFLDYPGDPRCHDREFTFLLGPSLLIANVVRQGAQTWAVYLPEEAGGWWNYWTGAWHAGGQELEFPVGLGSIPLFVRGGSVLPLASAPCQTVADTLHTRALAIFPPGGGGDFESWLYEDDGLAADALDGNHALITFVLRQSEVGAALRWSRTGGFMPLYEQARVILPRQFTGKLSCAGAPLADGDILPGFPKGAP